MPLIIETPHRRRERVLVYGAAGMGKTYDWFDIARATTGNRFWVVDTDNTVLPFVESEEFAEVEGKIELCEAWGAEDWDRVGEFVSGAASDMDANDWLVIDMADVLWDWAQDHFTNEVFGTNVADLWLAHRKAIEGGKGSANPFDGMKDWTTIKKIYRDLEMNLIRAKGHVMLVSGEKKLIEQFEDSETMRRYGSEGYKPAGEKNTAHRVHTVLRRKGGNRLTTIKDRQREAMSGVKVESFAQDYLRKVAGWRPVL